MLANTAILIGCFAISVLCVYFIIRYAVALGLVQAPVARSSHVKPTPAGGGVGIVLAALLAALILPGETATDYALLILALIIAVIGFIDDRLPLPAKLRLAIQAAVVAGALLLIQPFEAVTGEAGLALQIAFGAVLLIGGIWWINLFNFMDGIDGIAGQQAITMMVSAMVLSAAQDSGAVGSWTWWAMASVAAATLGFLTFNWPPAKVFMGDAGSTFLGFIILALAFQTLVEGWMTLPQWLLLALLFAADATTTLIVRFLGRDKLSQAHRAHAYQRLSRRLGGARPVSTAALVINLVILLPIAFVLPEGFAGWCLVFLAYGIAVVLALFAGAGLGDQAKASPEAYRERLVRLRFGKAA